MFSIVVVPIYIPITSVGGFIMESYSAVKKNKIMPFAATWMELEPLILSEISQKEKDKHHMISLISGI